MPPWPRWRPAQTPPTPSRSVDPAEAYLAVILERMTEGVLVLAEDLRPVLANRAAKELLGIKGDRPSRLPSEDILSLAADAQRNNAERETNVTLFFPANSTLHVRVAPLGDGQVLVTLRDVTQEVLAQKVRKDFVSHASHELKSPVASLQALAEAVQQALTDDPEAAARFTDRLVSESDRLGRLVNDLLDLSRLEETAAPATDPVDLGDLAEREIVLASDGAAAKGIEVKMAITPDVWVRGDEQQLALLVRNLLDNAVRYTGEGGEVTLEVGRTDGDATLSVADNGIGIPRDVQARVFERFFRVDRARSRERGGTGLGLAIVKHVAELHGGGVEIHSELGEGSTFIVRFPLSDRNNTVRSIAG